MKKRTMTLVEMLDKEFNRLVLEMMSDPKEY
jgi:hypothetical protein